MGTAAELALQQTGGSAALVAPPPLHAAAVRAVLGLQRPVRGAPTGPHGAPRRSGALLCPIRPLKV